MRSRYLVSVLVGAFTLAAGQLVWAASFGGIEFPGGAASFADDWVSYTVGGGGVSGDHANPDNARGVPDYNGASNYVSLGWGGTLVLRFTDNSLTTSGDSAKDLWIFEIGGAVEKTDVAISKNGTTWINVGSVAGSTRGVDLDAYVASGVVQYERYSYVKLVDSGPHLSSGSVAGADIDAVGAISSAAPVPVPGTLVLFGTGLAGLASFRRRCRKK